MCNGCGRNGHPGEVTRRGLLRGTLLGAAGVAAVGGAALTATGGAAGAATPRATPTGGAAGVTFRYLGTAGWELTFDGHRVLLDPFLSRLDTGSDFDPDTRWEMDTTLLDAHLSETPDLILVSHSHYDHIGDVPHLLNRHPGARVITTETGTHLLPAMGVRDVTPGRVITASGGEYLDFADGAFQVEVFRSLHSQFGNYGYILPGTLNRRPRRVRTVGDMPEGGTLAYQVTVGDRFRVALFGTANLVERELVGIRPDAVIVAMTGAATTHRYLERLLTTLGRPRYVIPNHHDSMSTPFGQPDFDPEAMARFRQAVAQVSPDSIVLEPETHLASFTL